MSRVVTRAEWGHPGPLGPPMRLPATTLFLHHSVTPRRNGTAAPRQIANIGIQRFGRSSYSYVITPDGSIYELQGDRTGAHTKGHNSTTLAVCYPGNYESDHLSADQEASTAWLYRHLVSVGRLRDGAPIRPHSEAPGASTACPGGNVRARIPTIRQLAASTDEEDDVKQEDIDKIVDGVITRIHAEGLTPRTKDDIGVRTWKADTHGKEARNRLHDIDVRTQQIRAALDKHREFDVDTQEA